VQVEHEAPPGRRRDSRIRKTRPRTGCALAVLAALTAFLALPASASAATTCTASVNAPLGPLPGTVVAPNLRVVSSFGFGPSNCGALRIAARSDGGTLWAWDNGNGLWSSDDGTTWTLAHTATAYRQIHNVLVLASGHVLILVRDADGLYHVLRSTDPTGTEFAAAPAIDMPAGSRLLASQSWLELDGAVYVGEYGDPAAPVKLWKSTDDGRTFTVAHEFFGVRHIHSLHADPYAAGRLWVTIGDNGTAPRVGYSDDGGASFTYITQGKYPESRVVSLMFTEDAVYWGTDVPELPCVLYRWDRQSGQITQVLTNVNGPFYFTFQHEGLFAQFSGVATSGEGYVGDEFFHVLTSNGGSGWSATRTPFMREPSGGTTSNSVILGSTMPDAQGRFWVNFWNVAGTQSRTGNVQFQLDPTASFDGPRAEFAADPTWSTKGQEVAFDGSASSSPAGGLTQRWSWGDGSADDGGPTASHRYSANGSHTARLQVRDAAGNSAETTRRIAVSPTSPAPGAVTDLAGAVAGDSTTLRGSATANGSPTTVHFQYGRTAAYGSRTPDQAAGSGTTYQPHSAPAAGLQPDTTYHYRLVATSTAGTSYGADRVLRTGPAAPSATTDAADGVTDREATLHATINPNGSATTVRFEYGTTTAYGRQTADRDAGAGNAPVAVDAPATGLTGGTTYHYRAVATSAGGTRHGEDRTFTTPEGPPGATTDPVTAIDTESATLNGTVDPQAQTTTVRFEYGETASYGAETPAQTLPGNLVPNPSFESSTAGWSTTGVAPLTFARQTGWASAGVASARFTPGTIGSGGYSEARTEPWVAGIQAGTTYDLRVDVNVLTLTAGQKVLLYVTWRSPTGASLGKVEVARTTVAGVQRLAGSRVAPPGTVAAQAVVTVEKAGNADLYIDDARILAAGTGATQAVSAAVTGLRPDTTYHVRVVAINGSGTSHGEDRTFRTAGEPEPPPPPDPPTATTSAATGVTQSAATLNGSVDPRGLPTTYRFDYREVGADSWSSTPGQSAGSGTAEQAVSAPVSGLDAGTAYEFRLVASSDAGPATGATLGFTTSAVPPPPPGAATSPATNVGVSSATLNGSVNPNGLSTSYRFEHRRTGTATWTATPTQGAGAGTTSQTVAAAVSGLEAGTAHEFRLVASSASGTTTTSPPETFTTAAPAPVLPTIVIGAPRTASSNRVELNGTVNPNGSSTSWRFQWDTSTSYGKSTPTQSAGSGTSAVAVSALTDKLKTNTVYHARLVAANAAGTVFSPDVAFTHKGPVASAGAARGTVWVSLSCPAVGARRPCAGQVRLLTRARRGTVLARAPFTAPWGRAALVGLRVPGRRARVAVRVATRRGAGRARLVSSPLARGRL